MAPRVAIAALLACGAALGSAALLAQQAPIYRSATQTVPVYATVTDGKQLITDLARDDFEVLDNGRPQPIVLFDNSIQPISIIVMLDTSGSMAGNMSVLRNAAVQMFTRLLPDDKARVGNFGDRISISPEWTNNVDDLIRTLWLDIQPGGPTPLWGAVNVAMTAMARLNGRRVVLVLSDGKDTGPLGGMPGSRPTVTLQTIVERAQVEDYMIYTIGFSSRGAPFFAPVAPPTTGGAGGLPPPGRGRRGGFSDGGPDPGLLTLAAESGGGYFEITEQTELGPAFARIADELHRQYLLGFVAPENDGKIHKIEVRVKKAGLAVRARNSYQAPRPVKLP
jgi:Ca-activated chloride channel family protein